MTKRGRRSPAEVAQLLFQKTDFGVGFQISFVYADFATQRRVRELLLEKGVELVDFRAHEGVFEAFEETLGGKDYKPDPANGVIQPVWWLTQEGYNEEDWDGAIQRINWRRDWLLNHAQVHMVVAGLPDLVHIARFYTSIYTFVQPFHVDPEPRQPKPAVFDWLHLSDFHFKADDDWKQRLPLQALLNELKKRRDQGWRPQALFLTGDIAFSGKAKEYERARIFFDELKTVLDHEPQHHWFLVPGNHDVDRDRIKRADHRILYGIQSQDDITDLYKDTDTMELLARRLEDFYFFTGDLLGRARRWQPHKPWRVDTLTVGDYRIAVLQLNGVWTGGLDGDKGRLMIGEHPLLELTALSADADLRIAMAHHPLSYLTDFDETRCQELLGADVDFFLRGHLHRNTRVTLSTAEDGYTELAAGAVLEKDPGYTGFMIGQLDLNSGAGKLELLAYSDRGKGAWVPDTKAAPDKAPEGIWTFNKPIEAGHTELTEAGEAALTERYREAIIGYFGNVSFIGLAETARRPRAGLEEIFVPLRMKLQADGEKERTTQKLIEEISDRNNERNKWVILGDPGSGKSTLSKYIAVELAARKRLPILIPFREYVTEWSKNKALVLMDYIRTWANLELNLEIPQSFIEEALEQGTAVLIFDGMDEVGSPDRREIMRNRIQALCRAWPKTPAIITSRIAGYDQAGLDPKLFEHLRLDSFSDEEQAEFVTRWYAIQETDPKVRDERTAKLVERLKAVPAAQKLASNPLLATLLALVHFYRFELPGQRARLYQLCVETLLETWPAQRGKPFELIDARLQIEYLSEIAWKMQLGRVERIIEHISENKDDELSEMTTVLIERDRLLELVFNVLNDRGESKSAAEDWLHFLEKDSGLIVEQKAGLFGFFHLSLLEYLASSYLSENEPLDFLYTHWSIPGWEEICLLCAGRLAENKVAINNFFEMLEDSYDPFWCFLLYCAKEEVNFTEKQLEEILVNSAKSFLHSNIGFSKGLGTELYKYSRRHGKAVENWLCRSINGIEADQLDAVAVHFENHSNQIFSNLHYNDQRTSIWLSLYPGLAFGSKAFSQASAEISKEWALEKLSNNMLDYAVSHSLEKQKCPAAMSLVLRLSNDVGHFFNIQREGSELQSFYVKDENIYVLPSISVQVAKESPLHGVPLERAFDILSLDSAYWIRNHLFFPSFFLPDSDAYLARGGMLHGLFGREFKFEKSCVLGHVSSIFEAFFLGAQSEFQRFFDNFLRGGDYGKFDSNLNLLEPYKVPCAVKSDEYLLCLLLVELMYTVDSSKFQYREVIGNDFIFNRSRNRQFLFYWPKIDDKLHMMEDKFRWEFSDYNQALYLALGYRVASTTHQWPPSERWAKLFQGPPPEFWMSRAMWYLCWLLHDPTNLDYRRAYDEAIEEGRHDAELPGYADALLPLRPVEDFLKQDGQ